MGEEDVRQYFSKFGTVTCVDVPPAGSGKRANRCFAFVTFAKKEMVPVIMNGEHYLLGDMTRKLAIEAMGIKSNPQTPLAKLLKPKASTPKAKYARNSEFTTGLFW